MSEYLTNGHPGNQWEHIRAGREALISKLAELALRGGQMTIDEIEVTVEIKDE